MSTYKLPDPEVKFLSFPNKVQLLTDFVTPEIIVPKDFLSDGVSSPWWARWIFPRYGRTLPAALVHDYCYGGNLPRKRADQLFLKNLKRLRISKLRAQLMYLAVRIGGKSHYERRQDEPQKMTVADLPATETQ